MPEHLESAIQEIVENARANCDACEVEYNGGGKQDDHTCRATIDAAAKGMLALWQTVNRTGCGCNFCHEIEATIKRLLEEAKK